MIKLDMPKQISNQMVIYQIKTGSKGLKAHLKGESIWLTQQQVAELFDVQKVAISKHAKNIFESNELEHKATVSKMETVRKEGSRNIICLSMRKSQLQIY